MREGFAIRVGRATESVRMYSDASPSVGVILGSGLSGIADRVEGSEIPYSAIEGFPVPTVAGHRAFLKLGERAAMLAGRFHLYEGHSLDNVVLPVFLLHSLGAKVIVVTNASGGINRTLSPGQIALISDHINLMETNPLIGPNDSELGERFPDMTKAYSARLRAVAQESSGTRLFEGVYAGLCGPSYETPAEIRMLERIGADMVGMSTVPEVIACRYLGLEVLGLSCITNMAAGILDRPLRHEEVVETGKRVESEMTRLVLRVVDIVASRNP